MQLSAALLSSVITCTAHYCLRCLTANLQCNICKRARAREEGSDPLPLFQRSPRRLQCFHDATCLAADGVAEPPSKRCSLSPNAL